MRNLRRRFLPLLAVVLLLCAAMTVPALAAGEDLTEVAGTKYIECGDCGTAGVVLSEDLEARPCERRGGGGSVGAPPGLFNTLLSPPPSPPSFLPGGPPPPPPLSPPPPPPPRRPPP